LIFGFLASEASSNANQCPEITSAPAASTLKCSDKICTAECAPKYKFPKGETTLTTECVNKAWVIKSPKYKGTKILPGCQPTCSPACANKGKCVAPNVCQCSGDFQGPTCREKACKQPPAMTRNAKRTCSQSQCTITCLPGFKFKSLATTMNIRCQSGKWVSLSKSAPLNSHCEVQCNPKCLNGGTCVGSNQCHCTQAFRGPQCQYAVDKCNPKKVDFNGSYNCSGAVNDFSCSFSCPSGIKFEFPPAKVYKCKYSEGKFLPSPMPKCVYDEGVQVKQRIQDDAAPARITSARPVCNPACRNGGTCIYRNTCQCPQNFAGSYCQHSIDRCAPTKLGFNGGVRCTGTSTGLSCVVTCPEGISFTSPPAAAYECTFERGVFSPANVPKCVYGEGVQVIQRSAFGAEDLDEVSCTPSCQNGGVCMFHNLCQCPKNFRGPQCQYSVDRCSLKNTEFNGGFRCQGSATELVCNLNCPDGVEYEFPPASAYTCKYETGRFTPTPIPKCIFGEGVEIVRRISSN